MLVFRSPLSNISACRHEVLKKVDLLKGQKALKISSPSISRPCSVLPHYMPFPGRVHACLGFQSSKLPSLSLLPYTTRFSPVAFQFQNSAVCLSLFPRDRHQFLYSGVKGLFSLYHFSLSVPLIVATPST